MFQEHFSKKIAVFCILLLIREQESKIYSECIGFIHVS